MKVTGLANLFDKRVAGWMASYGVVFTRVAVGIVFFWFGAMKFFPGAGVAEALAGRTISVLTLGHVPPWISLPVLASWECLIGISFITGKALRVGVLLLFLQLPGTFLPLIFFPSETWVHVPYLPTLEGQYIIKNVIIICAGLVLGATVRGGKLTASPNSFAPAEKDAGLARDRI